VSVAVKYQALPIASELFRRLLESPDLHALAYTLSAYGGGLLRASELDLAALTGELPAPLVAQLAELRRLVDDARARFPGVDERTALVTDGLAELCARFGEKLVYGEDELRSEGPHFLLVPGPAVAMAAVVMSNLEPEFLIPASGPAQDGYRQLRTLVLAAAARGELLVVRGVG
jgi:hypothetical protein